MAAPPPGIIINATGGTLNISNAVSTDNDAIPAPNQTGWTFTVNGTGFDNPVSGSNGTWGGPQGQPTLNLAGVGKWTMTATLNAQAAPTCEWDNESTTVTYKNKSGTQVVRDTITCTGGGGGNRA